MHLTNSNKLSCLSVRWLKIMAIFHCNKSEVQRSKGQNAIAAVAYISRSKLQFFTTDKETGEEVVITYNYSSRKGLAHSIILAPDNAPDWVYDRQELWNRAEIAETRKNSETARKLTIALPRELSLEQNIELIEQFAMEHLVSHGMVADINIHYDNEENPHVHIQMTTRKLLLIENGEIVGFSAKGRDWGRRRFLYYYRESVSCVINQYLEKYGHLSQVSHLSHKDRGIDLLPSIHEGAAWHIKDSRLRLENKRIVKANIAKIKEYPDRVFDKLSINKPVFTKEDIAKVLSDVLHTQLKAAGSNDDDNLKETLEDLNVKSSGEFMKLYSKLLTSDKIGIVVEEDLKGRTLYALTKRLDLEERYKAALQELSSSRMHSLNITEEKLEELLIETSIGNKIISSVKNVTADIGNKLTNSITQSIASLSDSPGIKGQAALLDNQTKKNSLNYEQRKAVLHILNGPDISILEGLPGTGKTYVMKEIVSQYKKAGYRVIGTATSSAASLNLASEAGIIAKNISLLRKEWQKANGKEFELALRADYYRESQYQDNKPVLTSKDILIIDEASMVELSNMDYMIQQVREAGAKVILIGDNNQFTAVGMAGASKVASDIAGSAKLSVVQRQRNPEQARATQLLGNYKIDEAIELYSKLGILRIHESEEETQKALVSDYINTYIHQAKLLAKDDLAAIKSVVICAYTNEAVSRFNQTVRKQLKEAGILKGSGETFMMRNKPLELMRGEQIVFEANSRKYGILNGEVGTVINFSRVKNEKSGEFNKFGYNTSSHGIIKILVNKADGSKKLINLDTRQKYIRFTYGYAVTAHKLEGGSIHNTLVYYEKEVGYEAFNVMMTRHRESLKFYANQQELEDNVYTRLNLDAEQAGKTYDIVTAKNLLARNLPSTDWPLWQVGLSISVSKRVNNSLASDYIGMSESSNDKLLKSYIESHSNVVKLLREIERWRRHVEKATGKKPNIWQHEAWDRVVSNKAIRDIAARVIVEHRQEFQDRINQMELNYATIAKHANVSLYNYKVQEKELASTIAHNAHYRKIVNSITKLQNELHNTQGKFLLSNSDSSTNQPKDIEAKVAELIESINSAYKSLQEDIIENRLEFDAKKSEYENIRDHHMLLKEQITEAENYRNKLMPEFLKRTYRDHPETILKKWQEIILEHGSPILASTAVYRDPSILGKLRGIGFGKIYGLTNSRVDALENTMVIGERLRKYESSLSTITKNSDELMENDYPAQEETLKSVLAKVILIEPTETEQEFIQLAEQIATTASTFTIAQNTTNGQDAVNKNTINLKKLTELLDKALTVRKIKEQKLGTQALTSQDIKEIIRPAKNLTRAESEVTTQSTMAKPGTIKNQSTKLQEVNEAGDTNLNNQDVIYGARGIRLQEQVKNAIAELKTIEQIPKTINIDELEATTYKSLVSGISSKRYEQEYLSDNQIRALVVCNIFETKYEKEINDMLQGIWYTENNNEPLPVTHRIKCQIDASRITKMSGYLIEQMIIDNPNLYKYLNLKKLASQAIISSIQKYQTRDEEIKKMLATDIAIQKLASHGKEVQHSMAEQLVDHIWQGGSEQVSYEQLELMKKIALLEQQLIPQMRKQFKEALVQEESINFLPNDKNLNKDIEAYSCYAINKIHNNIYSRATSSKDSTDQILSAKHQDNEELDLLSPKDYNKIIKQSMDYFNKAQEELKIERELQQDKKKQQQRQNHNMLVKM